MAYFTAPKAIWKEIGGLHSGWNKKISLWQVSSSRRLMVWIYFSPQIKVTPSRLPRTDTLENPAA